MTIRNGQSRDTDIDIHKNKTLEIGQSGMVNPETLTLTYTRKRRHRCDNQNGQTRDTDIDIHKKKTLEIGQSGMGNPETLTLTYTRKRR